MKILKVRVKKQRNVASCRFIYPEDWDSGKMSVLAYEDNPNNLGKVEEGCLCITDDATAAKLLSHPGVREVTVAEANAFGRKWRPSRVGITDETKVMAVIKKLLAKPQIRALLKDHLKQEEIDSLDEDKPDSGIGKGKEFNIEDHLQ